MFSITGRFGYVSLLKNNKICIFFIFIWSKRYNIQWLSKSIIHPHFDPTLARHLYIQQRWNSFNSLNSQHSSQRQQWLTNCNRGKPRNVQFKSGCSISFPGGFPFSKWTRPFYISFASIFYYRIYKLHIWQRFMSPS